MGEVIKIRKGERWRRRKREGGERDGGERKQEREKAGDR